MNVLTPLTQNPPKFPPAPHTTVGGSKVIPKNKKLFSCMPLPDLKSYKTQNISMTFCHIKSNLSKTNP